MLRAALFPRDESNADFPVPHSPRALEIIWGVIPAAALVALLWATWRAIAAPVFS